MQSFDVKPLGPLGVEVSGIDLDRGIDAATAAALQDLLLDKEVVLFRGQQLSDAALLGFARRLGTTKGHPLGKFSAPGFPDVLISSNVMENGEPVGIRDIGQFWHTDGSYLPVPYQYTLLYGVEIPHDDNGNPLGDTLYLSATAAYDALSPALKNEIDKRIAIHSYDYRYSLRVEQNPHVLAASTSKDDARHPMVYRHPLSGRPALFVNEGYVHEIDGMPRERAQVLLKELFAHLQKPQFAYRHRWKAGDLIMWDNVSTQHNAVPDYKLPQRRYMKRITITQSSKAKSAA